MFGLAVACLKMGVDAIIEQFAKSASNLIITAFMMEMGILILGSIIIFALYIYVAKKEILWNKSMRETIKRIETDAAFRWFLGIPFTKPVPHYSTFSQNYIRRFQGTDVFEQIFINIVNQAIEKKLVGGNELLLIQHILKQRK